MTIEKYEVIKVFKFTMVDLDFTVSGRIVKLLNDSYPMQYLWEISHFYKPFAEAATVYTPSNTFGSTAAEAEAKLMTYVDAFTNFDVTKNTLY